MPTHKEECAHRTQQCEHCGKTTRVVDMAHHQATACPHGIVVCSSADDSSVGGCGAQMTRREMMLHSKTCPKVIASYTISRFC